MVDDYKDEGHNQYPSSSLGESCRREFFLAILLMILITATLLRAELLPGGSLSSSTFVLPSNVVCDSSPKYD